MTTKKTLKGAGDRIGIKRGREGADERSNNEGVDLFIVIGSPWTWLPAQTHRRYNCMRVYGVSVDYYYYFIFKILTIVRT